MSSVFDSAPYRGKPSPRDQVLSALADGEWHATGGLYGATNRVVPRAQIHAVLKELLQQKVIRMRLIHKTGGRPRTEFRLNSAAS